MATFTLTTGADTFVGGSEDDTVNGTAATLNPGDSLTGGGGNDTLALYGSGFFAINQLANFTGFKNIMLNNFTTGFANLTLGSQTIAVTGYGTGGESVTLGSGAVTFQGGGGQNTIYSASPSNWNAANVINEGSSQYATSNWLYLNSNYFLNPSDAPTYDLTTNTLVNVGHLYGYGSNLTVKINSADAAGVSSFSAGSTNDQLVTSDATLDLSHSTVSDFRRLQCRRRHQADRTGVEWRVTSI